MIVEAIQNLKERTGSSRPSIKKYILNNFEVPEAVRTSLGSTTYAGADMARNVE